MAASEVAFLMGDGECCGEGSGARGKKVNGKLASESADSGDDDHVVLSDGERDELESKEEAALALPALAQEVLARHGSPLNPSDQIRTLRDVMLESERDICIFAGAVELLASQCAESARAQCCSVCARALAHTGELSQVAEQLDIKRRETEAARDESNVLGVYAAARQALAGLLARHPPAHGAPHVLAPQLRLPAPSPPQSPLPPHLLAPVGLQDDGDLKFESRVAFNMRSGALTELRNQKAECLQDQRCFACLRAFPGTALIDYLRRVDWNANQMQERLHVHRD
jgi:hypothetical protein